MASRKEEKERLRRERLEREQAAASSERRRRILGIGVGGALALAAVVAVVVAVAAGGGGDDDGPKEGDGPKVPIPAQKTEDLQAAAKAAGCRVKSFTPGATDRQHTEDPQTYKQNPPVFGPHSPTAANDGNYVGQGSPGREAIVHSLEHGRVIIWYKPTLAQRQVGQLETLFSEPIEGKPEGYKQVLVQDADIPGEIAASGWGQQLTCPTLDSATFDALRAFRAQYVDKGPEDVPFPA